MMTNILTTIEKNNQIWKVVHGTLVQTTKKQPKLAEIELMVQHPKIKTNLLVEQLTIE